MKTLLQNLRPLAANVLMAALFAGGVLLGGSEFVGFPWGPLVGVCCWVSLLMVVRLTGVNDVRL